MKTGVARSTWTLQHNGAQVFDYRQGQKILLFTASREALGPTLPPIQWVRGALSQEIRRPGRETDHSPPSSAEVRPG
jgi:hypothetical protein